MRKTVVGVTALVALAFVLGFAIRDMRASTGPAKAALVETQLAHKPIPKSVAEPTVGDVITAIRATELSDGNLHARCGNGDKKSCDARDYFTRLCFLATDYDTLHVCIQDGYPVDRGLWDSSQPDNPNAAMRQALLNPPQLKPAAPVPVPELKKDKK